MLSLTRTATRLASSSVKINSSSWKSLAAFSSFSTASNAKKDLKIPSFVLPGERTKKPKKLTTELKMSDYNVTKIALRADGTAYVMVDNKGKESYVRVPSDVAMTLPKPDIMSFTYLRKKENQFTMFQKYLTTSAKAAITNFKKKIILKGLGFKMSLEPGNILSFKLGFSHSVEVPVPDYISNIRIKKNILILESSNKTLLGNFTASIVRLRPPETYKEKGFYYHGDKVKLRPIKKK